MTDESEFVQFLRERWDYFDRKQRKKGRYCNAWAVLSERAKMQLKATLAADLEDAENYP